MKKLLISIAVISCLLLVGNAIAETLTVTKTGKGSVLPNENTSAAGFFGWTGGRYDTGEQVTLIANPAKGYRFEKWVGDALGPDNPLIVTMDKDKTVSAIFIESSITVKNATLELKLIVPGEPDQIFTFSLSGNTETPPAGEPDKPPPFGTAGEPDKPDKPDNSTPF